MGTYLLAAGLLIAAYILGSIPWGLVIVWLIKGQDVRKVESGRTGGTNVGRAAGIWAGIITAFLDAAKGTVAVWLAIWLLPQGYLVHALAGVAAVLGHNYSIFLAERVNGQIRLRGGAGGATTVGSAFGLWWPSLLVIIPASAFVFYFVGYASLATLMAGISSIIIFSVMAVLGIGPWQYIIFGVLVEFILLWGLRPNLQRLIKGNERVVGLRARKTKSNSKNNKPAAQN